MSRMLKTTLLTWYLFSKQNRLHVTYAQNNIAYIELMLKTALLTWHLFLKQHF